MPRKILMTFLWGALIYALTAGLLRVGFAASEAARQEAAGESLSDAEIQRLGAEAADRRMEGLVYGLAAGSLLLAGALVWGGWLPGSQAPVPCPECGKGLRPGARHCPGCGARFGSLARLGRR